MLRFFLVFGLLVSGVSSWGQGELVENEKPKAAETKDKKAGWYPKLKFGANLSYGSSAKVIGQVDGETKTFGLTVNSGVTWFADQQEWRQSLDLNQGTSSTASLPRYVKSQDDLKYDTIYLYSLKETSWLGPYAKASLQTSIFKGEDVRAATTTYKDVLGGTIATSTSLPLTEGFKPLTTKESVGLFASLVKSEDMDLEGRVGLGAQQVSADGQLAVKSYDAATNTVVVKQLSSYTQSGGEVGVTWKGQIDKKTKYQMDVELFQPFSPKLDAGDERSGLDLLDSSVGLKLSSKIYEWAELVYEYRYKRQPLLQEAEQVSNYLLLNFSYEAL
ncbi:MAG: hypothetical protein KDD59_06075 [Bdellovibrionales bacterium]|nr:hypothetical protein [Bdellovibrionales bacterium]